MRAGENVLVRPPLYWRTDSGSSCLDVCRGPGNRRWRSHQFDNVEQTHINTIVPTDNVLRSKKLGAADAAEYAVGNLEYTHRESVTPRVRPYLDLQLSHRYSDTYHGTKLVVIYSCIVLQ